MSSAGYFLSYNYQLIISTIIAIVSIGIAIFFGIKSNKTKKIFAEAETTVLVSDYISSYDGLSVNFHYN